MSDYKSEIDANALFAALTADCAIEIPGIDLSDGAFNLPGGNDAPWYAPVPKLTNADLTTKDINGTGTFDVVMSGYAAQLKNEYEKGRITGAEYTKAFIAMGQAAMQFSVQFLLGRDAAFWSGVQAQIAAITARVELEAAKVKYAQIRLDALTGKANYALTKLKLATEDATYGAAKYNVDNLMPQQLQVAIQQVAQSQQQILLIKQQIVLSQEQTETARAQTLNTRTDNTPVTGVLGKQKDLYAQQITSYQRDAEVKAAKIFSDAWITMKTIDEGLVPPTGFTNNSLNTILQTLKTNNGLG